MDFSFISDEQFRSSLVDDHRELMRCQESGSWKAVHVLAGSIVEALLIEYLVVSNIQPNGKDPLTLALYDAVQACQSAGVIQKSTASLCDVIRDYRNLIHPGRVIRLQQQVDAEGASIAVSLVALITREVAAKRKATYGPVAEQIVKKIRTDQHSLALLPQLLSETKNLEKIRLVQQLLPDAYRTEATDFVSDDSVLARLKAAYRQTLDQLPDAEKRLIAGKFAAFVRQESSEQLESYGDVFFLSSDLVYLSEPDALIIVEYLISRLDKSDSHFTPELSAMMSSLGKFVPLAEIRRFAEVLIRLVVRQSPETQSITLAFVGNVYDAMDDAKKRAMEKRIEGVRKRGANASAQVLAKLDMIDAVWSEIPF